MPQRHTELSAVGEFGLIEEIRKIAGINTGDAELRTNLLMGISDDAAAYRPTPGKVQLLTTDAFVEGIHFDLNYTSFPQIGWKAIAANISDIAAMGGIPRYAAVALSLPKKISVEMVMEFYRGALHACRKYSCLIVGGDTTTSMANMLISVSMVGEADEKQIKYRKDAKPGEYICVTGHLGASLAGLKVLLREKERLAMHKTGSEYKPDLEPYAAAVEKHLMPKPRLDISKILTSRVKTGAMIDISDGLASEVRHICLNSNVGASVYEHNIPVENVTQRIAVEFSESPTDYALYGGEEYELLFTIDDIEYAKLESLTDDVTIIGRVTDKEKGIILIREQGEEENMEFGGWDHFNRTR